MIKKIFLLFLSVIMLLLFINFSSINDYSHLDKTTKITISIDCCSIYENYHILDESLKNTEYIPKDGVILPKTVVYVGKNDSVLDALKSVTKENNIQLEYSQSPNDSYVEGINYIYEFSCGELSGWMYKVNGNFADKGCNSYIPEDGDYIEWVYTCNLGKDVGNNEF